MNKFRYETCCVEATGRNINDMVHHDNQRDITYGTFVKKIGGVGEVNQLCDGLYGRHFPLKNDHYVTYASSYYRGRRCVYMTHSAIEYIFTEET